MSRENVEAAHEVLSAVERRDRSRLVELTDPEIEWRSFFADLSEYHGHDGLIQYLRDLDEAFEWLRPEVGDMLDVGDLVVGVGRIHYRGKESGAEADMPAGWLFRFSGGRLRGFRAFSDPEQALEDVGLRE
jgi:ketosteroid isomerase-like protein